MRVQVITCMNTLDVSVHMMTLSPLTRSTTFPMKMVMRMLTFMVGKKTATKVHRKSLSSVIMHILTRTITLDPIQAPRRNRNT